MEHNIDLHLFCFPLGVTSQIKTISGMHCFHLIWLRCCLHKTFDGIEIRKKDRNVVGLSRSSYVRGVCELEEHNIIHVERKSGRLCRISVNTDLLDEKAKASILKKGGVTS